MCPNRVNCESGVNPIELKPHTGVQLQWFSWLRSCVDWCDLANCVGNVAGQCWLCYCWASIELARGCLIQCANDLLSLLLVSRICRSGSLNCAELARGCLIQCANDLLSLLLVSRICRSGSLNCNLGCLNSLLLFNAAKTIMRS